MMELHEKDSEWNMQRPQVSELWKMELKSILLRNKEVKSGDSKHDKTDLKSI